MVVSLAIAILLDSVLIRPVQRLFDIIVEKTGLARYLR
jgi:hypothetical protein